MNIIFSLLYAPVVFITLKYFDIHEAAIVIFVVSFIWLLALLKHRNIMIVFPIFYMAIALFAYFFETPFVLKILPLIISILFSLFLFVSYVQKRSLILYFAKKYTPYEIDEKEAQYIQKSTLFWFTVTLINIVIHLFVFLRPDMHFWLYYSSFGWYFLFLSAGVMQYIHRKFWFITRNEDV
jgi:uncharacterized membrane protein